MWPLEKSVRRYYQEIRNVFCTILPFFNGYAKQHPLIELMSRIQTRQIKDH